jgi:hypothetical protein
MEQKKLQELADLIKELFQRLSPIGVPSRIEVEDSQGNGIVIVFQKTDEPTLKILVSVPRRYWKS